MSNDLEPTAGNALVPDMSFADYLADPAPEPSLTSSVARALLTTAPAKVRLGIPRLNPLATDNSDQKLDIGTAAHALFIGRGEPLEVIEADSYRTNAAKDARVNAYATGKTPVLAPVYERLLPMADAAVNSFMGNPDISGAIMRGMREATAVWREKGVMARCRPDVLYVDDDRDADPVPVVVHYKTTSIDLGDERAIQRLAVNGRWDVTAAHYEAGIEAVCGLQPAQFFAIQEAEPPYLCVVRELDAVMLARGAQDWNRAVRKWARCVTNDEWPALPIETGVLECPPWHAPDDWEGA